MFLKKLTEVGTRKPRQDGSRPTRSKVFTIPKEWMDGIKERHGREVEYVMVDFANDNLVIHPYFPDAESQQKAS